MSDNGVKEEERVQTRDEAGDDEVRAWPSHITICRRSSYTIAMSESWRIKANKACIWQE